MNNKVCNHIAECKAARKIFCKKGGYTILECTHCQFRFLKIDDVTTHLSSVYSDSYFSGGDEYPNYLNQKSILYNYGIKYAKVISKFSKPGKILDIGSAAGFILKGFKDSGWDCYGIEPNETMAQYARTELGLNVSVGSLETYTSAIKFNLISLIQVVGHLYDLDKAIKNIHSLIEENGMVLVESWNMKSYIARLLGKRWHEYTPPSVINWFSRKTLEQLFESYGFKLIAKGKPSKKINVEHFLTFYEHRGRSFPLRKAIFKSFKYMFGKINIIYPPIDIDWYLFKKI